jgi:hypothetical protein
MKGTRSRAGSTVTVVAMAVSACLMAMGGAVFWIGMGGSMNENMTTETALTLGAIGLLIFLVGLLVSVFILMSRLNKKGNA